MRRHPTAPAAAAVVACLLLAGCSDDGAAAAPSPSPSVTDPAALLDAARKTLDGTACASFDLDSADVPAGGGAALLGGAGDLVRPDGFRGTLDVRLGGSTAQVEIVSVGGDFYAKLPFTADFAKVDPASLGFTDPGTFMDPDTGISQLLSQAQDPVAGDAARVDGDLVREVRATLPGALVADLLVSADPAEPVTATFAVTQENPTLRRAVLTGPFYAEGTPSTFTILLRDCTSDVRITPPA